MTALSTGRLTLAVTGASGTVFARSMLQLLQADDRVAAVTLVVTDHAMRVAAEELELGGRTAVLHTLGVEPGSKVTLAANEDIGAGIASGSHPNDGMVVLPCSMGTLASIAHGLASRLIERAADVCLKEARPLVLCVRETPFNRIHLRNMVLAAEAGATIFPVIPALYFQPSSIDEIAKQFCCRVLAHLGLPQANAYQWKAD